MVNKQIAQQNSEYARAAGESEAQAEGMKARAGIGETKAQQGAGGLDVNSGSNAQVRQSEEELGEYNQSVIRSNAAKKAYGYEVDAQNFQSQAALDQMASSTSKTSGFIGAVTSILGGAASVSGKWSQAKTAGVFS